MDIALNVWELLDLTFRVNYVDHGLEVNQLIELSDYLRW